MSRLQEGGRMNFQLNELDLKKAKSIKVSSGWFTDEISIEYFDEKEVKKK